MYSTIPHPHLPWLDLWQYGSEMPLVLAGPFGPLVSCGLDPMQWSSMFNPYAFLPTAWAGTLNPADETA
jgi:hypothetical protein